jgi:cytochrome c biogenesis factor
MDEATLLRLALGGYAASALALRRERVALALLGGALALHTLSLALRWQALGHGPFTTLHEILSSNLWSLALVFALAAWALPAVRGALAIATPVWLLLLAWLLVTSGAPGHFPPTYDTMLLYLHTLVGKLYLGLLLVAVALALRAWRAQPALDELAHRFAAFAFVFETLMLIVGAVWAMDAWGRYWAWDPLESWAFVSWLALAAALHARATFRPQPKWHALWLAGSFVLAFLTFFGVPFLSTAPHKGAI